MRRSPGGGDQQDRSARRQRAKVKQDLLTHGVVLEEFGGTTLATPISAKTGQNVQELLDQILLQASCST